MAVGLSGLRLKYLEYLEYANEARVRRYVCRYWHVHKRIQDVRACTLRLCGEYIYF